MVDALIRRFLGTAGSGLLDFYLEYGFWINAALFIYAILVVFARRNYGETLRFLLTDFIDQHGEKLGKKSRQEVRALLLKSELPWETGMRASRFPFISSPQGLLLRIKSDKTFKKIFPIDILVETVVRQTSSRSK
ncbi:MAG TPA: hypothetical protein VFY25_14300 [Anaerolineales bacterium]|nr:hypothetical protein [Anaerolineales bacterium]